LGRAALSDATPPATYFQTVVELERGQLLDLVFAVEERLRRLVRAALRSQRPDWERIVPERIRNDIQASGPPDGDLLDRATLGQLISIVLGRWTLFEARIPLTKEQFRVKADDFRAWRNSLAHGHAPSADEKVEIAVALRQVGERIPVVEEEPARLGHGVAAAGAVVLWVDDHPEWTATEREVLRTLGVNVIPALSNPEALALANTHALDLVISDIDHGNDEPGDRLPAELRALGVRAPILFYVASLDPSRPPPGGAEAITDDPAILIRDALTLLTRSGA
jgi:CheY-like chemotaxis protein